MTWSYRADHDNPGVYMLTRDGEVVGGISLLEQAGWRIEMLVQDAVHGLNFPQTAEERGFHGPAADLLARRRQKLAQEGRR